MACPVCDAPADSAPAGWAPACASCGAAWRSPAVAALLSVGLPGLGHWYLGRRAAAILEASLGAVLLLASLVHLTVVFLASVEGRGSPFDLIGVVLRWAPVLIGYCLIDGALTWIVSRHRIVARTAPGIAEELRGTPPPSRARPR